MVFNKQVKLIIPIPKQRTQPRKIAPGVAVPRNVAKRNEEYKRNTGRLLKKAMPMRFKKFNAVRAPTSLRCCQPVRPRVDSFFECARGPFPTREIQQGCRVKLNRLLLPIKVSDASCGKPPWRDWPHNRWFDIIRYCALGYFYRPLQLPQIRCPIPFLRGASRGRHVAEYRLK